MIDQKVTSSQVDAKYNVMGFSLCLLAVVDRSLMRCKNIKRIGV